MVWYGLSPFLKTKSGIVPRLTFRLLCGKGCQGLPAYQFSHLDLLSRAVFEGNKNCHGRIKDRPSAFGDIGRLMPLKSQVTVFVVMRQFTSKARQGLGQVGCDPGEGEYTLHIAGFIGSLDIGAPSGVDDVSLIQDCVEDNIPEIELPIEGVTELILKESGEWEDVFWHKYYVIDRVIQ